jgi:HK97 family phage prohead protease
MDRTRLETYGYLREVNAEDRTVVSVVSTNRRARDNAIIDPRGWVLDNYQRNPVVLWAHDDHSLPIARTMDTVLTDQEMIQKHQFGTHPMAVMVFDAIQQGMVNATSVRWIPLDARIDLADGEEVIVFTRSELLEVSYVPIPADPGALVMRADGTPLDLAAFRPRPHAEATPQPEPESTVTGTAITVVDPDAPDPRVERAEALFVRMAEWWASRPDPAELVVTTLARLTGRSEDRIRADLARMEQT